MPTLVPITPSLTDAYRQTRLRALHDSPSAFGSTYARESQLTDADWRQRTLSLDGLHRIAFLAFDADTPCGLVACFRDPLRPTQADVLSMWVSPTHRATGLSRHLLDAVRQWATTQAIQTLRLMVVSHNTPALTFYRRYGFTETGNTEPYPNDPTLFEIEMILKLTPASA